MELKTFVICIIGICSCGAEGFPEKNNFDERLVSRGLGDYVSSWFWSSKNTEEDKANVSVFDIDQQDDKSIIKNCENGKLPDEDALLRDHSESKILGQVNTHRDQDIEEIHPMQEIPEGVQPENVEKIIEELKKDVQNTDNEEKTKTLNLWKSLTNTVSDTTSPYVEVVYKNARRIIDIGAFGTSKRSRCFGEIYSPFSGLLGLILQLFGLGGGLAGRNQVGLASMLGMPPTALSSSQSNSNAGALSLAGLGGLNPVGFVSLQDIQKIQNAQTPNLGGGNQVIADLLKLGSNSQNPGGGNQVIADLLKLGGNSQPNLPSSNDPNNMLIMALLLRLLANGNGGSTRGTDTNVFDLSKLSRGNDNSGLMTLVRQLMNRPETNKDVDDNDSRVVIIRSSDLDDSDRNGFEMFNIRGTPEERFTKIQKKIDNNPDLNERIIIVDELNQLRGDPRISKKIRNLIDSLELNLRSNKDYEDIWEIAELTSNGKNKSRKFGNIEFIDDRGDKISKTFSDDEKEKIWKELMGSLSSKYKKKDVKDPNTLRDFLRDLNMRNFDD